MSDALPTVDALLGPPKVDDLLGPPPLNEQGASTSPPAEDGKVSLADRFFENTAPGRILTAIGHGARDAWGSSRLGMSEETAQAFRDVGIFQQVEDHRLNIYKTFNEAIMRPAAVGFDALMRGTSAAVTGAAAGVGQTAQELGMEPAEANRGVRDVRMALESVLTVLGGNTAPIGTVKGPGVEATKLDAPVAETGTLAQRPFGAAAVETPKAPAVTAETVTRPSEPQTPSLLGKDLEEVEALQQVERTREQNVLLDVFGTSEQARKYTRLEKLRHSASTEEAASRYSAQFDEMVSGLSEEQIAKLETIGLADDMEAVRRAVAETTFGEGTSLADVSREAAYAARQLNKGDVEAVMAGTARMDQQANVIRFGRSFGELRRRGLSDVEIQERLLPELQASGLDAADAQFLLDNAADLLRGARPATPPEAPPVAMLPAPDTAPPPRAPAAKTTPSRPTEIFDKADDGPVDRAGNINLDRIAAPDDVKNVIREVAQKNDDFVQARRAPMSFDDIRELSDAVGLTPDQLLKRKVGDAFNAEEALAARNLLVQSATNVRELAAKAQSGADADVMAFQEAMTKHMAIQEQVAGLTAEAGRALASFKIVAGETKDVARVIEEMGGAKNIRDVARMITELDTPQQVSRFAMEARKATTSQMLMEAWINSLLSGPKTHVTNVLSNTLVALSGIPETAVASVIGKVRELGGNEGPRVLPGEAAARLFGFFQGSTDGVIAGWRTFKTEIPSDIGTKVETPKMRAIPSKLITVGGRQIEIGGKQVRLPGRLLMAEDEFFRAIGTRQELYALAYRQARGDVGRIVDLVENPTPAMLEKARETADYQTFTKPLGETGQALQRFANSKPWIKVVIPFIRTPANILKFAGERSPFAFLSENVRKDLSGANGKIAQDTQMARMALGTSVAVATIALAAKGGITGGGPTDPAQRAVMYLTGWQPYSVKIGDFYYSYGRLEPLGTFLGVSADLHDVGSVIMDGEADKVAGLIFSSISKNLVSKSWLQGPADLIEAFEDSDRYGDRYVQRLVSTVVPTGVAQVARTEDPYLRDARTLVDAIKVRLPGQSQEVPVMRDIWGEPIERNPGLGSDLVSPISVSRLNNDPANQELLALKLWPAKLQREIRGVKLTSEQYDEYQRIAGRFAKFQVDALVNIPGWSDVPAFARKDRIKAAISGARETARTMMVLRHPEIAQAAMDARVKELSGQ